MMLEIGLIVGVVLLAAESGPAPAAFSNLTLPVSPLSKEFLLESLANPQEPKWSPNGMKILLLSRRGRWVEKNKIWPIKEI